MVIACGVNDLAENDGQPCSIERVFADIRLMAETGAARGFKVVIGSTPPGQPGSGGRARWNAAHADLGQRVVELNRLLKQYAEERGFVYADYHSALKDDQNGLKLEYSWTPDDRVHPSAAGYAVMEKKSLRKPSTKHSSIQMQLTATDRLMTSTNGKAGSNLKNI